MIKKSELRQVFENMVETILFVFTPFGKFKVLTWLITLDEHTRKIHLNAVTEKGLWSVGESYSFRSVNSAYQFMVRL